jgi:hypothetical protein
MGGTDNTRDAPRHSGSAHAVGVRRGISHRIWLRLDSQLGTKPAGPSFSQHVTRWIFADAGTAKLGLRRICRASDDFFRNSIYQICRQQSSVRILNFRRFTRRGTTECRSQQNQSLLGQLSWPRTVLFRPALPSWLSGSSKCSGKSATGCSRRARNGRSGQLADAGSA